jgi:hypothetical protein
MAEIPLAPPMESDVAWVDEDPASWPEAPAEFAGLDPNGGPDAPVASEAAETVCVAIVPAALAGAFLARTQPPLARMRVAFELGDARQVEVQARVLEGLCSAVGATDAEIFFARIASATQSGPLGEIAGEIERAASEVRAAMGEDESRAAAA